MIRCLFHQSALRRHLDAGAALEQSAQAHFDSCPSCRAVLEAHQSLVRAKVSSKAPPPFLRARIMNSLRAAPAPTRNKTTAFEWALGVAMFAMFVTLSVKLSRVGSQHTHAAQNSQPTQAPWKIAAFTPTTITFEQPLETELASLQADTMNAARALAANFLP